MYSDLKSAVRPALVLTLLIALLLGIAYPLALTGIGQALFPAQANGSLIRDHGTVIGSDLIGQKFTDDRYFHGRPSAAGTDGYDASASGGSNLGPTNPALREAVRARIAALRAADPGNPLPVPADLVMASASGLDPHISPEAAAYQAGRVARARGLGVEQVRAIVAQHTAGRQWGFFGEPRVQVLELNLALDALRR